MHLPQIVDLVVAPHLRGQGYGAHFIREMEKIAARTGAKTLSLSVDFPENLRAHALYRRLGYRQIQSAPYRHDWEFTDSDGIVHQGNGWLVDMSKSL